MINILRLIKVIFNIVVYYHNISSQVSQIKAWFLYQILVFTILLPKYQSIDSLQTFYLQINNQIKMQNKIIGMYFRVFMN